MHKLTLWELRLRRAGGVALRLLAMVLWLVTCAVALLEIITIRGALLRLYVRLAGARGTVNSGRMAFINVCPVSIVALLTYLYILGSGHYHWRRLGSTRSWGVLGITVAVEAAIIFVAYAL